MVKEIQMDPDDIIEYVRNNVKVDDIFELSYNRVFAPGTVLGLTPEDEETGEGLILSLQLNGELLNQAVDIDLHAVKDEIIEFRHMPGGDEDKLIIAEDLGDITDEVRALVDESGFPGMRIFQFGFLDDGDSIHAPHNYIKNSVAYSGTHDNNTLFSYLWESDEDVRRRTLDYCGFGGGDWGGATPILLRAVFASVSDIAIIPVQDFLMYGSDTRINTPGVADGNWSYRVTKDQLMNADKEFFKNMNRIYKR